MCDSRLLTHCDWVDCKLLTPFRHYGQHHHTAHSYSGTMSQINPFAFKVAFIRYFITAIKTKDNCPLEKKKSKSKQLFLTKLPTELINLLEWVLAHPHGAELCNSQFPLGALLSWFRLAGLGWVCRREQVEVLCFYFQMPPHCFRTLIKTTYSYLVSGHRSAFAAACRQNVMLTTAGAQHAPEL